MSHRTPVSESAEASAAGSVDISPRGTPSISMGLDSYVAAQRRQILAEEAETLAQESSAQPPTGLQQIVSAVQEETSRLTHKHSSSNPLSHRSVASLSVSQSQSQSQAPTHRTHRTNQHSVDERPLGGAAAMLASTAAAAGSHTVVSVAADEFGNPIGANAEPTLDVGTGFERQDQQQQQVKSNRSSQRQSLQSHITAAFGNQMTAPPEPAMSASPSMHRVRSLSGTAGAAIMAERPPSSRRDRPASRQIDVRISAAASQGASRPATATNQSADAFSVQYAATAASTSLEPESLPLPAQPVSSRTAADGGVGGDISVRASKRDRERNLKASRSTTNSPSPAPSMSARGGAAAAAVNPNWRATKGGGGGLIKIDLEKRTATTLAGTVLPADAVVGGGANGSARGAPSTRRKRWDKENPTTAPAAADSDAPEA